MVFLWKLLWYANVSVREKVSSDVSWRWGKRITMVLRVVVTCIKRSCHFTGWFIMLCEWTNPFCCHISGWLLGAYLSPPEQWLIPWRLQHLHCSLCSTQPILATKQRTMSHKSLHDDHVSSVSPTTGLHLHITDHKNLLTDHFHHGPPHACYLPIMALTT